MDIQGKAVIHYHIFVKEEGEEDKKEEAYSSSSSPPSSFFFNKYVIVDQLLYPGYPVSN